MIGDLWALVFALFLIALNAFFVGAEFALISSRKDRLESILESGDARARAVINATEHLSMNLAGGSIRSHHRKPLTG